MAKSLKDFTLRINLNGWYIKKVGTFSQGNEVFGENICERMVQALESKETFILGTAVTPVCVLRGGTLEELKAIMAGDEEPEKSSEASSDAAEDEGATAVESDEEDTTEVEDEKEEILKKVVKKTPKKKKIVRKPRSN